MSIQLVTLYSCLLLFLPAGLFAQITGSLDTSFNHVGWRLVGLNMYNENAHAMAVQADGKLVLAGYGDSMLSYHGYVVRLNADGSLDGGFGNGGSVRSKLGGQKTRFTDIVVLSDGKLILTGFSRVNGTNDAVLARYHPDGSLDHSFGSQGGYSFYSRPGAETFLKVFVLPDGRLLGVGSHRGGVVDSVFVGRFLSDGQPDMSFGNGGFVVDAIHPNGVLVLDAACKNDGGLVLLVGGNLQGQASTHLVQLDSTGQLDLGFAVNGIYSFPAGELNEAGHRLALQADGKIVVAGGKDWGWYGCDHLMFRFLVDGSLDASFGVGGKVMMPIAGEYEQPWSVLVQVDGKIVCAGLKQDSLHPGAFYVTRQLADGSLDQGFGAGGLAFHFVQYGAWEPAGLAVLGDGRIVVGGTCVICEGYRWDFFAARIHGEGLVEVDVPSNPLSARAYPNPNTGSLHLNYSLESPGLLSIRLVDVQGRILNTLVDRVEHEGGNHREVFDLERLGLPAGMYLLLIETSDGTGSVRISYQP